MALPTHRTHTLIVRLWPEPDGVGHVVWRGSIDYVQNGQRYYFQTLEGLGARIVLLLQETTLCAADRDGARLEP